MLAGDSTWIFTSCTGCEFKLAIAIVSVLSPLPSSSRRPLFSAKLIPAVSSLFASMATESVLDARVASAKKTVSSVATVCTISKVSTLWSTSFCCSVMVISWVTFQLVASNVKAPGEMVICGGINTPALCNDPLGVTNTVFCGMVSNRTPYDTLLPSRTKKGIKRTPYEYSLVVGFFIHNRTSATSSLIMSTVFVLGAADSYEGSVEFTLWASWHVWKTASLPLSIRLPVVVTFTVFASTSEVLNVSREVESLQALESTAISTATFLVRVIPLLSPMVYSKLCNSCTRSSIPLKTISPRSTS